MKFTIYAANCIGNAKNTLYPHEAEITSEDDMLAVITRDHVCGKFKNSHRAVEDFISSDVEVMDCDNHHSENPEDWLTKEAYEVLFPDVTYAIVPSRHDGKVKGSKSARPRQHIYFPHEKITDSKQVESLKARLQEYVPAFDDNALDAARFVYGCTPTDIVWHEGSKTIVEFLDELDFAEYDRSTEIIGEGSRNSTMSHIAGKLIKRYGNTERAYEIFLEKSEKCNPPLDAEELDSIWHSAQKFYAKVSKQAGYISPDAWENSLKPDDYSDIGQAKVLAREYEGELVFTESTDYLWIVYNK